MLSHKSSLFLQFPAPCQRCGECVDMHDDWIVTHAAFIHDQAWLNCKPCYERAHDLVRAQDRIFDLFASEGLEHD